MNSDRQLQERVLQALDWEPSVNAAHVGVSATAGTITLNGHVTTSAERAAAERTVRQVRGVRDVANELTVQPASDGRRTDAEIAAAVADSLAADSVIPLTVGSAVADGWVTLKGAVEWQFQKSAAQIVAERMSGVKGVLNLITIEPRIGLAEARLVKANIEHAFTRSAVIDAARIGVDVRDATVVLTGSVGSLTERDEAERAAWSTPGVRHVDDRLTISPRTR